jgi:NADPH:quinone reductase-like Zn-dependent oxidoreductase
VPIPDWVTDQTAAAIMLKGMTSQYLICRTFPVRPGETVLSQRGSLFLTRPTLATARDVFEVIREDKVKVEIRHTYPLAEAVQVHRDLEGRRTVGSIVMVP